MQKEYHKESRLKDDIGKGGECIRMKTILSQRSTNNEILIILETKAKNSSKENAVSLFTRAVVKTPKGVSLILYKSSTLSSYVL